MVKTLIRHGNSLALIIDKPVLELLKIDENTPMEISTEDGKSLKIVPVRDTERRKKFEDALKKTNQKFGKTLKSLA
jgi:antitoxin component of MazEF toxin-antitoxin module